jgi:ATP-dependent DNA ligase
LLWGFRALKGVLAVAANPSFSQFRGLFDAVNVEVSPRRRPRLLRWPVEPMRAAGAAELTVHSSAHELAFEPKWDGFRALAWTGRDGAELQSRHGKSLTSYFPDVCRALADHLPTGLVIDGELVSWDQTRGRTSFDHLRRRITAGRDLAREATQRPAHFVAFDLLQDGGGRELLDQSLSRRRRRLERLLSGAPPQLPICPQTKDADIAREWFADWSTTGIEGLVVKQTQSAYRPGQVGWVKVKNRLNGIGYNTASNPDKAFVLAG